MQHYAQAARAPILAALSQALAERDELKAAARIIIESLDDGDGDGNAPGHCHSKPGIWDEDNGNKAGKPCEWCAQWKRFMALGASGAAQEGMTE